MTNETLYQTLQLKRLIVVQSSLQALLLVILLFPSSDLVYPLYIPLLAFIWLIWVRTFYCNYRLVDHGTVSVRYEKAPSWVNSPKFIWRIFLHVVINWSTLFVTILFAWSVRDTPLSNTVSWVVVIATVGVWVGFNMRHRRMNHLRNISLSTAFATTLLMACFYLIGVLRY